MAELYVPEEAITSWLRDKSGRQGRSLPWFRKQQLQSLYGCGIGASSRGGDEKHPWQVRASWCGSCTLEK